ncbi:MAG: anti-sigma factor [Pyrinomonadaceae bacterium]
MNDATTSMETNATADAARNVASDEAREACDCADVAAYLDGELSVAESSQFEQHLASCKACAAALADQRRLLCLLDAAFARSRGQVDLPEDFARVVKARAQTDMRSVRRGSERRRSLALCLALGAFALALFVVFGASLAPLGATAGALLSVLRVVFHTAAEAAMGAALVLRSLGRYITSETDGLPRVVVFAALACAILLLLRLISDYHRQRLHD